MGAGRKRQTFYANEKSLPSWTPNGIGTARNLRTSDLAAVIFGCKRNTLKECFSNSLFGLPAPHYNYVKNIYPGMPLFLFNYSDRKLHGIYEAACHGRLNINPQAWTEDGSDPTPYAAQVKFCVRMQCQPLVEDQFSPILAENYYASKLFWFELDQDQTKKLISLFSSLPMSHKQNMLLKGSFGSNAREKQRLESQIDDDRGVKEKEIVCVNPSSGISYSAIVKNTSSSIVQTEQSHIKQGTCRDQYDVVQGGQTVQTNMAQGSCSSKAGGMPTSLSQKPWNALFHRESAPDAIRETENANAPAVGSNFSNSIDEYNVQSEQSPHLSQSHVSEAPANEEDFRSCKTLASLDTRQEAQVFNLREDCYNLEWSSSCISPSLHEESLPSKVPIDGDLPDERLYTESNSESLYEAMANRVIEEDNQGEGAVAHSTREYAFGHDYLDINSSVGKLLLEVEELKQSQARQARKINFLEQELIESRIEMQHLEDRCKMLESSHLNSDELLLVAGGYDGSLWLSGLDSYSPFQDLKKPLASMNFARGHASAANLNGELYVFGGVLGDLWYDTVESYNPTSNQWVSRPPLTRRKGHLAGASLNNKIFAVGGGFRDEYFSEVEMLDVNAAKWIPVQSMLQKRYGLAAAEINGILYVVGGYNGGGYLNSVERFDPREHSWAQLESMNAKRGWHSLAVLNEKIYAMGGYDGEKTVPTVEVFDPRTGSWMMEGSMSLARGYFGAFVMRDSIFVIGGLNDSGTIFDTVECYKENQGWRTTGLRGIGRRCFFCAAVV